MRIMTSYTPSSSSQMEPLKMKLVHFSNEFPHDDLQDLFRRLHNHSKNGRHPVLARFLDEATRAIRSETRQLPTHLRSLMPPVESILELANYPELRKGPLCGSLEGVLLCVTQLATLIGYLENDSQTLDLDPIRTCLTGLGIGLLVSASVAICPTIAEIPQAGAEVVRIAFRLGVFVHEVSQNLQPRDQSGSPDPWAYVVPDVTENDAQAELDAIHLREKTPEASKVFVSALSQTSITISGPPARLQVLFRTSSFFRDRKFIALPVYGGLCHAPHIYNEQNARSIVSTGSLGSLSDAFSPSIPVFSTGTGRPYIAASAMSLFEQIVSEILTQKIQWDNVVHGVTEHASRIAATECQVFVFRISLPIYDLVGALKNESHHFEVSTEDLIPWIAKREATDSPPRGPMQSKIAIVGMACRMPSGATDTEKFWELLESGLDVSRKIPADRFDVDTHYDPAGKRVNASHTAYGCFIDEPGLFDAPFFNMSPREAQQTDPMQRLALVTAYEALERAGYVANRTAATNLHRIGTFYGQASDDYREVNTAQEIGTYFIPGGCRAFGPGRINYFFKFSGPSFSCDTACSSSLATIQAACTSLWSGDTDTVVAGGMNVLTNSDAFAGLSHGHFLSKTPNACKTWDAEADGYCRADGIGSIVMKRLEDAEADNDNILGVILAAATNHSAEAISITHPHAGAQAYLYRQVLSRAGVDPLDVNFVEMHGTGTQAGDSVEITSVTDVFAPLTKRRNSRQPLYIGAVKANVGHGEAVAGVTALLKVLLMLQKNAIPPHVGIKNRINPGFPTDLEQRNLRIPYEKQPWPHVPGKKRVAVVNNFSAAGGNTTIAIEEAPVRERSGSDPRTTHVVAVSAKSKISMKGNVERMIAYINANPDMSLSDLSYSTTARRYHHNHRVAIPTSSASHLLKQLGTVLAKVDSHKPISATGPPDIAFAFTGQGASHKSMNLELFHHSPYFKSQILHLDSLGRAQGFPSFVPAVNGDHPQDHGHSPVVTQLALVCVEIALARYFATLGVHPNIVIGHSLGEYAALHLAGVLSANDTIFLVGKRAQLLETRCRIGTHKMMAVRASLMEIQASVGDLSYEVACINGPKDTVLSGTVEEIEAVAQPLQSNGFRCIDLNVAFAFHSAQTDPVLDEFEDLATSGVVFHPPNLPIISPLLEKVIFDDNTVNATYMRRSTRETVNFLSALENTKRLGMIDETTAWVEVGPHPVCIGFVKSMFSSVAVTAAALRRGEDSWATMATSLGALHCAGVVVDWAEFHRPFENSLRLLDLPTYAWNDKNYWIMYNGDWALTKGNTFYDKEKGIGAAAPPPVVSSLKTALVHRVIDEVVQNNSGHVVMQSDLMQAEFLAAANGHSMNGCGVVTSSIHADIAYTLGEHLFKKFYPSTKNVHMNIANLEVLKGLVAKKNPSTPQLLQVSASTTDITSGMVDLKWSNVGNDGTVDEPFASANLYYGDAEEWLASWAALSHLVQGRMESLEQMAKEGAATKFSHNMAYQLFANNLVDYAAEYRGMQSVVLNGLEGYANVELTQGKGGKWTVPPFFIDSVAHLAGFIMNVSDAIDTKANFCVTPGWSSMRFARPLVAGARYRSYTKMIPTAADPSVYLGDVYILQEDTIIGMVGGIKFRRYPRVLLNRFFSAPDDGGHPASVPASAPAPAPAPAQKSTPGPTAKPICVSSQKELPAPESSKPAATKPSEKEASESKTPAAQPAAAPKAPAVDAKPDSIARKAIALIANETALDVTDLVDEASFGSLGIDSLMSLVVAEKFREELGISVGGSLFLEYPTMGDLRAWLEEYYS